MAINEMSRLHGMLLADIKAREQILEILDKLGQKDIDSAEYLEELSTKLLSLNKFSTKEEYNAIINELNNFVLKLNELSKINNLIPDTTTADNKLADKNFVNSSISTATAEFHGTVEDLDSLNSLAANINDYAFYKHKDESGNTVFDRYKFNDQWEYEYTLNNTSFTAEQWATINSGITENSIPTKTSELINDSNFAISDEIPTKTSELTNDSNFITAEEVPANTFLCTYGVTTYQEIQDAIDAGKWPYLYVKITDTILRCYRYNGTYSNTHLFISVYDGNVENNKCSVNTDNVWSRSAVTNLVGSASETMIANRNNRSWGISTVNYDSAVRHALCDADDSTSYNPAYTDEQKSAARNKIGAIGADTLNNYVDLSSDQNIDGKKIFSEKPVYTERIVVGHNLPDDYQEVEYIQSSGTQYIDTGINPKIKPRVVVNMMLLNSSDQDYWGNKNIDASTYFANFADGVLMYYRYGSTSSINTGVGAPRLNEFYEWDVSDVIYLNKVKVYTTSNVYTYNANQSSIYLFKSGRNSYGSFRASYFILYDGDEKVREYYPCYRKSDNAVGLFDKVSNTFFPNLGSGVFTKGDDVISGETIVERELISNSDITAYLKNISNYDVNKTQVLKNVNGIFQWVDE